MMVNEQHQRPSSSLGVSFYPQSINKWLQSLQQFSNHHRQILPSFLILAFEKILLNEIDKLIVVSFISFDAWGFYALVSNLGSIVCRLILAPLEELAAVAFSTARFYPTISPSMSEDSSASPNVAAVTTKQLHLSLLATYVGCECFAGLFAIALGSPISAAILYILYGSKWICYGSHWVLQRYFIYLFALSINGSLEAYMYSRASATWLSSLKWINASLWLFSTIFIVCMKLLLMHFNKSSEIMRVVLEASFLIYGNLLSIVLRILIALVFILYQIVSTAGSIQTSTAKRNAGVFLWLKCLRISLAVLPAAPFVGIVAISIFLRLAIRTFASGGIEAPIETILLSADSTFRGRELVESYARKPSFFRALFTEVCAASIGCFALLCFSLRTYYKLAKTKCNID